MTILKIEQLEQLHKAGLCKNAEYYIVKLEHYTKINKPNTIRYQKRHKDLLGLGKYVWGKCTLVGPDPTFEEVWFELMKFSLSSGLIFTYINAQFCNGDDTLRKKPMQAVIGALLYLHLRE